MIIVAAIGALERGEPGVEVAAVVELADDVDGVRAERSVDGAVAGFLARDEIGRAVMANLLQGRGGGRRGR